MTLTAEERCELDRLVAEQAADLEWLGRVAQHYPLAVAPLWTTHNPSTGWDQRGAVAEAMTGVFTVVKGGWRSGKSEGLKQLTVANAIGGDHPMVRRWLGLNDLPNTIPDGPAQVYAIAQSSNDSLLYHREDFARMIGTIPHRWMNRSGKGQASLELFVPGYQRTGKIWFKAIDQTRRAFQGISIRWAWIDEEPIGPVGFGVCDELRARVADQAGRIGISMIPTEGLTWVYERLERDGEWGARFAELDALDNPHLPESFRQLYVGMSDDEIAVRRYGRFRSRSGTIYAWVGGNGERFGPGHLCDPFELPPDWPRFEGADFGLDNPTCVLRGALGDDNTLYIYHEYYVPNGKSYEWHVEQYVAGAPKEVVEAGWGDPSAPEAIAEFAKKDVYFGNANNDVKGGIDLVRKRMRIRGDNRPRLKVFRSCPNLLRELPAYLWDPKRKDEYPLKKDDHSPDALRYLVIGIEQWLGL